MKAIWKKIGDVWMKPNVFLVRVSIIGLLVSLTIVIITKPGPLNTIGLLCSGSFFGYLIREMKADAEHKNYVERLAGELHIPKAKDGGT